MSNRLCILLTASFLALSHRRKSSLSTVFKADAPSIRVAPRPKRRKQVHNAFFDDRGFSDPSSEYDQLLTNVDGGTVLRKLLHPAPDLSGPVDPRFYSLFVPAKHESIMRKSLNLSHLTPDIQEQVYGLIREVWSVFDEKGFFVPVKNYECVIDTGDANPIAVRKILYGEKETVIMRKHIAALAKVGHIRQIHDGGWLFKAVLAPKPHQEHVTDIDKFDWRFCVNYIPLNGVTRQVAYPIPRCDSAVFTEFGCSILLLLWMWDAPQGYHQLAVSRCSQPKLAFQGVDAIKWTYNVMPFGPTNGPSIFITFMHDLDSVWKKLATDRGITIDSNTNTRAIVDDVVSWSTILEKALAYMRCQLQVCQAYNLSLKLSKSHIFPQRFEFVGVDVCADGNRPAQSKHVILQQWPEPFEVRCVAKFVGFAQFYSRWIPNFELRIPALRSIITDNEYGDPIGPHWTSAAKAAFDDIRMALLSDPVVKRFDHTKLVVLRSDFSSFGFGFVLLQPGNNHESIDAAAAYRAGKGFSFMDKDSKAVLHPICFGARRTRGNETRLHSHLGEGFAGDYAINKVRQYVFGQRFVWVTDCYAIKFILSYEGGNAAVLRLQMRLMCWDCDIIHRPGTTMVDADYWSRLGVDIDFDPLYQQYLSITGRLKEQHQPPTQLPMLPENMPYYKGPRVHLPTTPTAEALHLQTIFAAADAQTCLGHTHLSNIPIKFGTFASDSTPKPYHHLYNSELASYAFDTLQFSWAVYTFSNGHFPSTIAKSNLPFQIRLACDVTDSGRSLFGEFAPNAKVYSNSNDLLQHIRASGDRSHIHGYLINTSRFKTPEMTNKFWTIQNSIISQLRFIRSLSVVVAIIIPDHDGASVKRFITSLSNQHWSVSTRQVSYDLMGDSIADSCTILTAIHTSCASSVEPIKLAVPPLVPPHPIAYFNYEPFNRPEHSLCYGCLDAEFNNDDTPLANLMNVSKPTPGAVNTSPAVKIEYYLHRKGADSTTLCGSSILAPGSLCPPYCASPNVNIFRHLFGVEFHHEGHTYVRPISTHEFTRCFQLTDNIQYRLSHDSHVQGLDASMPGRTSAWLFQHIFQVLLDIRDANTEILSPNQAADPCASIQTLVGGTICTKLPSPDQWVKAYSNDTEMCALRKFIMNPSLINNQSLSEVNHNYRGALRQSYICIENDMLIFKEPIGGSSSFTRLQIVPREFYNIIFIAFHTNPIGGHLNAYRTLHRIRLRFYFPGMFSYITKMCRACPGCALTNPTHSKSSELIYNFPVEAPFSVMHFDAYSAGKHSGFEGAECYLIGCCGLSSFACMEPISHASATTFASGIMKILLHFGMCFTAVLDKDRKFFGVCRQALDLLNINCHVLSGDNHNPMLVERINRYLNKGLKIMCNERESVRVAQEAIHLLIYAWNACPIPGTDISRSLVAVGREFRFPIDYSTEKKTELASSPKAVLSYSHQLALRLDACAEVAKLLVNEHRAYHRELINSRRPNPKIYKIGDIVFARRAVRSNASRGIVDKLQFAYTGPWRVTKSLDGASYELEHADMSGRKEKKHASDLSPYPAELVAFQPLDGPDNRYGQLYKPISKVTFREACLKGFEPSKPFATSSSLATTDLDQRFRWPSLSELNDELDLTVWQNDPDFLSLSNTNVVDSQPVLYTGPPPQPPELANAIPPSIEALMTRIIASDDRLFFVSICTCYNDIREWRLVQLKLDSSMSLYPSCSQDGRFLFDVYLSHPSDWRYNAINQRFWLQYHHRNDIINPTVGSDTHLVRPSPTSSQYAVNHQLQPLQKWFNITHTDTYIHGPFDFATINGRKSRDRISHSDWQVLRQHLDMFQNPVPSLNVPTYSIHVDRGAHTQIHDKHHCLSLIYEASNASAPTG